MDIQKIENSKLQLNNELKNMQKFFTEFIENYSILKKQDTDGLKSLDNYFTPLTNENLEIINFSKKNIDYSDKIETNLIHFDKNYKESKELSNKLDTDFFNVERNFSEMNKLIDNWENKTMLLTEELNDIEEVIKLANSCCKNKNLNYTGMEERQLERLFTTDELTIKKQKYINDQKEIKCLRDSNLDKATKNFLEKENEKTKKDTHTEIRRQLFDNER